MQTRLEPQDFFFHFFHCTNIYLELNIHQHHPLMRRQITTSITLTRMMMNGALNKKKREANGLVHAVHRDGPHQHVQYLVFILHWKTVGSSPRKTLSLKHENS